MALLHTNKILRVKNISIISMVLLAIGIIFKVFSLTGSGYFLGFSIIGISYLFILFALEFNKDAPHNPQKKLLSRLCYLTFVMALIGVLILFLKLTGTTSKPLGIGIWMFRFSGLLFAYVVFSHYQTAIAKGKDSQSRLEGLILMFASASYLLIVALAIIAAAFNFNIGALLIVLSLLLTVVFILPILYFKLWFRNVILTTLIIFSTSLNVFYFPNDEVSKLFHKEHREQMLINP